MAKLGSYAIDFGSSALKLIQIGGKASAPKIEKIDSEPLAVSLQEMGDTFPADAIAEALGVLLKRNKVKTKRIAVTIPGQAAVVRTLRLAEAPPDRIAQMIRYEAEPLIPFPLNECAFGYKVLNAPPPKKEKKKKKKEEEASEGEGAESGSKETEVLIVAVKNDRLYDYINVLQRFNIIPELIEITPYSSAFAFRHVYPDVKETIAVIDFGSGTTDISILKKGELVFTRAATVAGSSFTQALESKLDISTEEAEKLKRTQAKISAAPPQRRPPQRGMRPAGMPGPPRPGAPPGAPMMPGPAGAPPRPPMPPAPPGAKPGGPPAPPPPPGVKPAGPPAPPPPPGARPGGPPAPPAPPGALGSGTPSGGLLGVKPPSGPKLMGAPSSPGVSGSGPAGGGASLLGGGASSAGARLTGPPAPPPPPGARPGGPPAPPAPPGTKPGGPPPLPPKPPMSGGQDPNAASGTAADVSGVVQPLAERMLAEIRRSLEYYTSQEGGEPVTKIFITGGGSAIAGLQEFLSTRLNMEVEFVDALGGAKISSPPESPQVYQTAYGLALRLLNPEVLTMNLLPGDMVRKILEGKKATLLRYASVLAIVLLGQIAGWCYFKYSHRKTAVERLNQEYDGVVKINGKPFLVNGKPVKYKEVLQRLDEVEKRRNELETRFNTIHELEVGKYDWIAIMNAIREVLPEKTWIAQTSFSMAPTGVTLSLSTTDENDVRTFYNNVKNSPYLEYAGEGLSTSKTKVGDLDVWQWSSTLKFKFPTPGAADEYDEEEAAAAGEEGEEIALEPVESDSGETAGGIAGTGEDTGPATKEESSAVSGSSRADSAEKKVSGGESGGGEAMEENQAEGGAGE